MSLPLPAGKKSRSGVIRPPPDEVVKCSVASKRENVSVAAATPFAAIRGKFSVLVEIA